MTEVRIDLRHAAAGGTSPAVGSLEWQPTRRLHTGGHVVLPAPFTVPLVDGAASVIVAPTGPGWCWRVVERVTGGESRHVIVPADGPVDYGELVDVDPKTLAPDATPTAAWWAALENLPTGGPSLTPMPDQPGAYTIGG